MPTLGQTIRSAVRGRGGDQPMHDASPIDPWTAEAMKLMQFQMGMVNKLRNRRSQMAQEKRAQARFQNYMQKQQREQQHNQARRRAIQIVQSIPEKDFRNKGLNQLIEDYFPPGLESQYAIPAIRSSMQTRQQKTLYSQNLAEQEAEGKASEYVSDVLGQMAKGGKEGEETPNLRTILTGAIKKTITNPQFQDLSPRARDEALNDLFSYSKILEYIKEQEQSRQIQEMKEDPATRVSMLSEPGEGIRPEGEEGFGTELEDYVKERQSAQKFIKQSLAKLRVSSPEEVPSIAQGDFSQLYKNDSQRQYVMPELIQEIWEPMQRIAESKVGQRGVSSFNNLTLADVYEIGTQLNIPQDQLAMISGFFDENGKFNVELFDKHLGDVAIALQKPEFKTLAPIKEQQDLMRNFTYNMLQPERKIEMFKNALQRYGKNYPSDYIRSTTAVETVPDTMGSWYRERTYTPVNEIEPVYKSIFDPYGKTIFPKEDRKAFDKEFTTREQVTILRDLIEKEAKKARLKKENE